MKPDYLQRRPFFGMRFFYLWGVLTGALILFSGSVADLRKRAANDDRPEKVSRYIQKFNFLATQINQEKGIPFSIIFAVAGLESDWGRSELALRSNNHFGIKSNNWQGPVYCTTTKEWQPSRGFYDSEECFRWYPLIANSYWDFANFLETNSNYQYIFQKPTWDYYTWAWDLQIGGYATDPDYAIKLIRLVEQYRLFEFDEQ